MAPGASSYTKPFTFRTQWEGRERQFMGLETQAELGELIFFCLADEPERGNFVSAWTPPRRSPRLPKPLAFDPRFLSPMSDAATKLASECAHSWGRIFFLDENLEVAPPEKGKRRLFLSQDGGGEWRHEQFFPRMGSPFVWASREEAHQLALLAPLDLLAHFVSLMRRQPESDPARALKWDDLPHEERNLLCRPLARGNYEEWRWVLHLYGQSRLAWWNDTSHNWLMAYVYLVCRLSLKRGYPAGRTPFFLEFERLCSWMLRYFEPSLDVDFVGHCTAARQWSQTEMRVSARVERPTQHERIEALMQLRDWLSDKAAPEEIEALLRET